jgi:hypothetical protein
MTVVACPNPPPIITPGIVQFDTDEFLGLYPVFTPQQAVLPGNFALATTQLNNTCGSRVYDPTLRQTLLYLLTCHITQLLNGIGSTAATGVVGRIADASEGSVSVSAEWEAVGGPSQAGFLQTQWGAQFWALTAQFRTMRYIPSPQAACYAPLGPYVGPGYPWNGGSSWPWGGGGCCGGYGNF